MPINATFAQNGSLNHAGATPNKGCKVSLFIAPNSSLNNATNIKIVTNDGTAQGRINTVRINFLPLTTG